MGLVSKVSGCRGNLPPFHLVFIVIIRLGRKHYFKIKQPPGFLYRKPGGLNHLYFSLTRQLRGSNRIFQAA